MRLRSICRTIILTGIAMSGAVAPASAHHLMGGKIPSTIAEGLLSGLGHPVIGADHLAFLVALGVIVGVSRLNLMTPAVFVATMAAGVFVHIAGVTLPAAELLVALSVLLVGVLLARGTVSSAALWVGLFAAAGFVHGYAFGESIYGAEPSPLGAYLAGLVVVQSALTIGIAFVTRRIKAADMLPRLIGAAIVGVGLTVLIGQIVPAA